MAMLPTWSESKVLPKKLGSIDYSILSPADILKISEAQISSSDLYDINAYPIRNGPLDRRLGVGNQTAVCTTCNLKVYECVGHFGHSHLSVPIFHIGFFKHLVIIMKMVCKKCSRVLLSDEIIDKYRKKMMGYESRYTQRLALFKKIMKETVKNKVCPHCEQTNPVVQKIPKVAGKMQIRNPSMRAQIMDSRVIRKIGVSLQKNKADFNYELNPWQAYQVISRVPKKQWILLNIGGSTNIKNFIVQDLPIPPVCIRPSLTLSNSTLSNEDDLTINIKCLLKGNKELSETMLRKGDEIGKINKRWYVLQSYWSQYINSDTPGLPTDLKHSQIKSLCTRLKGKQGRFRQNLSGKRANFTARAVISPDPNLRPNQVIVPQFMSKIVTVSQTVTPYTMAELQQCIERGQKRGGANFVINELGQKLMIGSSKNKIDLKIGDIVERHLKDGDVVIFNRQPSLHRLSMMGFKVKISLGRTLRFNECVCAPFNADFDGDQMNIHIPQTYQARSQVLHLMGSSQNIITPKSGEPIIALIQDFLTTSFLLTDKDRFFNRSQFTQMLSWFSDGKELINLPPPTIIKPVALWTGKQVISAILRPNKLARVVINFQTKQKIYTSGEVMCTKDGWVIFKNSELLCGQIGKATLGGNKSGLIYNLIRDNTNQAAFEVMHRISKLSSRWLSNFGMTIGISDVSPPSQLSQINKNEIKTAYAKYEKYQKQYRENKLQAKPGMTIKGTLQSLLNSTLSKVRQTVGDNCISHLNRDNKPLIMALCGSKGSPVNLSQMIGCVGQQTVGGKRITYGFTQRTLPHFTRLKQSPQARGFVSNSFYSGLTPTEFFFHTMGGREGIIDTAVKTADTGYMQRRLIKLLQDVAVMYDKTVRTCDRKNIIQLRYGGDGIDPIKAEQTSNPINLKSLEEYAKNLLGFNMEKQKYLSPTQVRQRSRQYVSKLKQNKIIGPFEKEEQLLEALLAKVQQYFESKAQKLQVNYKQIKLKNKKDEEYIKNCFNGITDKQLSLFFNLYCKKLNRAIIQPGQAIGALTAQSIGEPATQMTLKTFHFAGISSMSITQGVPRINQIINCTKNIATPIITISLIKNDKESALHMKNLVQKLVLGKILYSVQQIYGSQECRLNLVFNHHKLRKFDLNVDSICDKIAHSIKSKIKKIFVEKDIICIVPNTKTNVMFELKTLKRKLVNIHISGISTIARALASTKDDKNKDEYVIFAEGMGFGEVLKIPGIDVKKSYSNHIIEVEQSLGIEAARQSIINQVTETMKGHGVNVNQRHVDMLAQVMTCRGRMIGFTRNDVDKMKDSTMMLASFEKTTDFLFDAATQGKHDRMRGISEKIIVGQPITIGTGMFDIKQDVKKTKVY